MNTKWGKTNTKMVEVKEEEEDGDTASKENVENKIAPQQKHIHIHTAGTGKKSPERRRNESRKNSGKKAKKNLRKAQSMLERKGFCGQLCDGVFALFHTSHRYCMLSLSRIIPPRRPSSTISFVFFYFWVIWLSLLLHHRHHHHHYNIYIFLTDDEPP